MPILSMFYGIVVRMYFFDDKQHHVPHLHAEYSGRDAVFSIVNGERSTPHEMRADSSVERTHNGGAPRLVIPPPAA